MLEAFIIYFYIVCGNLVSQSGKLVFIFGLMYLIAIVCIGVFNMDHRVGDREHNPIIPYLRDTLKFKWFMYLIVFTIISKSMYPTKDDLKYIIGGAVLANIVTSDGVKDIPLKFASAVNRFLDDTTTNDIKKEVTKSTEKVTKKLSDSGETVIETVNEVDITSSTIKTSIIDSAKTVEDLSKTIQEATNSIDIERLQQQINDLTKLLNKD